MNIIQVEYHCSLKHFSNNLNLDVKKLAVKLIQSRNAFTLHYFAFFCRSGHFCLFNLEADEKSLFSAVFNTEVP